MNHSHRSCHSSDKIPNTSSSTSNLYICPMHPEIQQDYPGDCSICGMSLEPAKTTEKVDDSEYRDTLRRFWIGVILTIPILILVIGKTFSGFIPEQVSHWMQFILSTPVVFFAGWPFFKKAWRSIVNRSLNMFTLIALLMLRREAFEKKQITKYNFPILGEKACLKTFLIYIPIILLVKTHKQQQQGYQIFWMAK